MRSIGRSLTISFLLMLLGVLGGTALVADRILNRTIAEKEAAGQESIQLIAKERVEEASNQFDQELLGQARAIGMNLQYQYFQQLGKQYDTIQIAMLMPRIDVGIVPSFQGVFWTAAHLPNYRGFLIRFTADSYLMNLTIHDSFLDFDDEHGESNYVQITNNATPTTLRSANLLASNLPMLAPGPEPTSLIDWSWSDVILPNAEEGRRVVFHTPLAKALFRGRRPDQDRGRDRGRDQDSDQDRNHSRKPSEQPEDLNLQPLMTIQCATSKRSLNLEIAEIKADAITQLNELHAKSRDERTTARLGMAAVGVISMLAVLIGAPILIARGLAPMRKLSLAVSQVSERDFRLPVKAEELSRELMPIHERLQQTLEALKRAFDREKQAVGDISHELRTPLAALLATIEVSLRKPRSVGQYQETLQNSRAICKQMSRLVDRIMTLAMLDSNDNRFKSRFTDALDVVESCEALIRPLAESNGLSLKIDVPDSAWLMTDPDKLREVLINLLHNAIEYNQPDGTIYLTLHDDGEALIFEIQDMGIGMDEDVRSHIFERFYRADSSRHATGIHAGLGLAVVKEYLTRMDGTIDVESSLGEGTTFRVTLPKRLEDHPALPEHSEAESPALLTSVMK